MANDSVTITVDRDTYRMSVQPMKYDQYKFGTREQTPIHKIDSGDKRRLRLIRQYNYWTGRADSRFRCQVLYNRESDQIYLRYLDQGPEMGRHEQYNQIIPTNDVILFDSKEDFICRSVRSGMDKVVNGL